jgi:hypothetical protein
MSLLARERLDRIIKIQQEERIMNVEKTAREMAPMEKLLKASGLLRDVHYNVIQRLRMIRENMMGPIPENPTEKIKTEGNGAFGVLQDRLAEMGDLLNGILNEIIRIENAMGVYPDGVYPDAETPTPTATAFRIGR